MSSLTYENIVGRLVQRVPSLKSVYDEHLADYDELLPHVFFGDLTRYVVASMKRSSTNPAYSDAVLILKLLDDAIQSTDPDLQDLVSVSFIENLAGGDDIDQVRRALGPAPKKELEAYEA